MASESGPQLELASTGQLLSELVTRFYVAKGFMADYAHGQIRGLRTMIEHYEPSLVGVARSDRGPCLCPDDPNMFDDGVTAPANPACPYHGGDQ